MTDEQMAEELRNNGWLVVSPSNYRLLNIEYQPAGGDKVQIYRDFVVPKEETVVQTFESERKTRAS